MKMKLPGEKVYRGSNKISFCNGKYPSSLDPRTSGDSAAATEKRHLPGPANASSHPFLQFTWCHSLLDFLPTGSLHQCPFSLALICSQSPSCPTRMWIRKIDLERGSTRQIACFDFGYLLRITWNPRHVNNTPIIAMDDCMSGHSRWWKV